MTKDKVTGLFAAAEIIVEHMWELPNMYWPSVPEYDDVRTPWWLVKTSFGLVQIGFRKRVISISWEQSAFRGIVTDDDVTKSEAGVHAWGMPKALEYLTTLRTMLPEPDPWDGITPEMALRAAAYTLSNAGHDERAFDVVALLNNPAQIRELAGDDDGL